MASRCLYRWRVDVYLYSKVILVIIKTVTHIIFGAQVADASALLESLKPKREVLCPSCAFKIRKDNKQNSIKTVFEVIDSEKHFTLPRKCSRKTN